MDGGIGVHFGPFRLEHHPRRLWRKNKQIGLQPRPLAVLAYLIEHAERVIPKEELLAEIWAGAVVSQAVLKVAVRAIREALGEDSEHSLYIETVGRDGYRFRFPGASAAASSPPVDSAPSTSDPAGPVVGRELALDRLTATLRQAQRGERQVVFVAGEPGIGKTTLVEQFARSVQRGFVGWGRCVEHYGEGEAYLPVLEALGEICRGPEGRVARDRLGRYAPTWLSQLGALLTKAELDALAPRLVGASRERMLRELAEALEALGSQQTVVLVLEDLHVSDHSTVELLGYLAQRRGKARLLILGTYRSAELVARQHPLRGLVAELKAHQQCMELPLEVLNQADVRRYIAGRLRTTTIPERLAEELHARTEGLPLFLANVTDYLIAQGVLNDASGQWQLAGEPESWQTPDTLRDLINHQIDGLPPEEVTVLEAASAAGVEFSVASVAGALGLPLNRVEDLCEALTTRSGLVREQGLAERPDGKVTGRYAFRHALHRRVLYQRLPEAKRARLHRAIGESDEAAYGDRSKEIAPALAVHFERGRDLESAARYRRDAADLALERHAYKEALAHALKGVELLSTQRESADRARRLLALEFLRIRALIRLHGHTSREIEAAYARARALCEEVGDPRDLFYVLLLLSGHYKGRAEYRTADQVAAQSLELAEREQDSELIVGACYAAGSTAYFLAQFVRAQQYLARGLSQSRPEHLAAHMRHYGLDLGAGCAVHSALCLWFLGYPDQAGRLADKVFTASHDRLDPLDLASLRLRALWVYGLRRRTVETQRRAQEDIEFATRMDFAFWRTHATLALGWNLVEQGHIAEGISKIEEALVTGRNNNLVVYQMSWRVLLADAYVKAGRAGEALQALDDAERVMMATDERFFEAELYRVRGEAKAHLGRQSGASGDLGIEARASFLQAIEVARQQQSKSLELRALTSLARLEDPQGQKAARRELQRVYGWFTEGFETGDLRDAQTVLAGTPSQPPRPRPP